MHFPSYGSHVRTRLAAAGFAAVPIPEDLQQQVGVAVARAEEWGRLLLLVAAPAGTADGRSRAWLAEATAAWTRAEGRTAAGHPGADGAEGPAPRTWTVLVFPFGHAVPEETQQEIRALRQEGPHGDWGLTCWTADLEVGLIDRPGGFPRVGPDVVRAVVEVDHGSTADTWAALPAGRAEAPDWRPAAHSPRGWLPGFALDDIPATRLILAATVAAYIGILVLSPGGLAGLLTGPRFQTLAFWGANHGQLVLQGDQQWRLFTYMLLHGGVIHLGMNMWVLWSVGRHVEMLYGGLRTLFIYVVAGVAGGFASAVLRPNFILSVGASGAVLGLFGALVYFGVAMPGRVIDWRALLMPVGMNLAFGFLVGGVDNYAHLGGLIGGFLAAFLAGVAGQRQPWRTALALAVVGLVALVMAGLIDVPHMPLRLW